MNPVKYLNKKKTNKRRRSKTSLSHFSKMKKGPKKSNAIKNKIGKALEKDD